MTNMTKQAANYRIIQGMSAVGNQCKNCVSVVQHPGGKTHGCKVLNTQVKLKGHCDKFERAEDPTA
jgi:hypothetical protein